jgi:tRNA-binding EMAP/Myf-like protein
LSAEVFDSEDVPSPDNFIQKKAKRVKRSKHMPHDDDGEQYEYGDVETHAIDADTSDFSPHQFIAPDEARDPMGSDDNEQDAASNDAARSKILSAEVFDSEDVPSADNFLQISKKTKHMPRDDDGEQYEYGDVETHAIDADTSDFSPHQFIAPDEARDPMGSDDNEQDAASNDAARSKILSAEVFDSEDVPSPDNFLQISKKTKHMPRDYDSEQY